MMPIQCRFSFSASRLSLVVFLVAAFSLSDHDGVVTAFQSPPGKAQQSQLNSPTHLQAKQQQFSTAVTTFVTAAALVWGTSSPALASDTAAQVSLNKIPPTSIQIQIPDLPVIGPLVSGTYTKVDSTTVAEQSTKFKNSAPASIVITSPSDKVKAISSAVRGGHLEFDIKGVLQTHLDVDVAADTPGTARIVVSSPLIPQLPFKNMASLPNGKTSQGAAGKESAWSVVTNLGSGESYYFNAKTGVTQFERPQV